MLTSRISAKDARNNFGDLLGQVRYSGEPVIVEKKGRAFAVLISPEDFERFQQIAKEQFFETVREIRQANKDVDPDQVLADVTEAVEAVRQEEYERKTAHPNGSLRAQRAEFPPHPPSARLALNRSGKDDFTFFFGGKFSHPSSYTNQFT